ncbi:MAG TPA: hypothetical protein VFV19_18370 [Candidatus Polarisedimenticolaceae bacterium]|nr:hypothetical protein [Candidatus Polarisedimenticolaceae bacterium]
MSRSWRWLLGALLLIVAVVVCARYGLYRSFSTFVDNDDEGYVLISIKFFLQGYRLYSQVFTQYGPLFYSYAWLLHGIGGVAVTSDAARFVTLVDWLCIAGLYAWFVHRAAGSTVLACAGFLLAFQHLDPIVAEPGHPQGLCTMLTAAILVLCSFENRAMLLAGVLIGLLAMVKINLGVYLFLAVALSVLMAAEKSRITGVLRAVHILLGLAVTPVVMHHWLTDEWTLLYWILWTSALASILLVARPEAGRIPGEGAYVRLVVGAAVTAAVVIVVQVLQGVPIARLFYGVIGQHVAFADAFYFVLEVPRRAAIVAVVATAAAVLYRFRPCPVVAARAAKLLYGLSVIVATAAPFVAARTRPGPTSGALMLYGLPFAWLLLVDTGALSREGRLARVALCLIAAFQALQVFPIAGTQVALGTVLLPLAGLLCVHDAVTSWAPATVALGETVTAAALLAIAFWRGGIVHREYRSYVSLELPGAERIRLPEVTAKDYGRLVRNLRERCDSFVTFPGTNSLYLWAQKEPATSFNATYWPNMLDTYQQLATARTLAGDPNSCFVLDRREEELFEGLGYSLLANYLKANFHTEGTIGPYDLRMRNDRHGDGLIP